MTSPWYEEILTYLRKDPRFQDDDFNAPLPLMDWEPYKIGGFDLLDNTPEELLSEYIAECPKDGYIFFHIVSPSIVEVCIDSDNKCGLRTLAETGASDPLDTACVTHDEAYTKGGSDQVRKDVNATFYQEMNDIVKIQPTFLDKVKVWCRYETYKTIVQAVNKWVWNPKGDRN